MRIYVASSWRNELQPLVVYVLRSFGHEVYDFRNPPGGAGFGWEQVNPDWKLNAGDKGFVNCKDYRDMLAHPIAAEGYQSDLRALRECEAVIYVLPCGRSASWELGYAMGMGKPAYVVWFGKHEPELMFREATIIGGLNHLAATFKQATSSDAVSDVADDGDLRPKHHAL